MAEVVVDECTGLVQTECLAKLSEGGDNLCGYNTVKSECYEVVKRVGVNGHGNFDDGYVTAQQKAAQQSGQLTAIIGVLCAFVAILIILAVLGFLYIRRRRRNKKQLAPDGPSQASRQNSSKKPFEKVEGDDPDHDNDDNAQLAQCADDDKSK
eukprot:CAMPEP_0197026978 /NCGR_PEP_ID=MMETSP1384-20130603/6984_1 /TAXON_ID=29189 /ORGANISM="Ammonia sp." /LENGTH=152 /DNA_ID=CAMNT_0042455761 /DNA_START=48 /DNA_END=506 /DNA_ORIENTATION=+